MRGSIAELPVAHPLSGGVPAVYVDDDFTVDFVGAFDDVLATVFATLDCMDAYFDPRLAPVDFVSWLATWVGLDVAGSWSGNELRDAVKGAVRLHGMRGTLQGITEAVRMYSGVVPEIDDSGGSVHSRIPGTVAPGVARLLLVVRLVVPDVIVVDREELERVIVAMKPAHVPHQLELLSAVPERPPSRLLDTELDQP